MNLANEVSILESEHAALRAENESLRAEVAMFQIQLDQRKAQADRSASERDDYFRQVVELKTLLNSTGTTIVSGVQKFHAAVRDAQERELEVGGTEESPSAKFLASVGKD